MSLTRFFSSINAIMNDIPVSLNVGDSLYKMAVKHDLIPDGCGGEGLCGGCHCTVISDHVGSLNDLEEDMMEFEVVDNWNARSRLGCQMIVTEDMEGLKVQFE
eukprot:gnl/Dysnectes_brevis/254_a285_10296.p1 GENE.gnl/Dysnectes_brevis/254_a285_10296~~gnl/Dysnectes_brevis/254_a285_10296.p1  ORF type:complete len:103 (+),score=2.32 gnl/Dysnectes_brevis/254_a285_10296:40-348(+)